jgi:hypothetical protein
MIFGQPLPSMAVQNTNLEVIIKSISYILNTSVYNISCLKEKKKVVIVNSKLTHNLFARPLIHYYTGGLWI